MQFRSFRGAWCWELKIASIANDREIASQSEVEQATSEENGAVSHAESGYAAVCTRELQVRASDLVLSVLVCVGDHFIACNFVKCSDAVHGSGVEHSSGECNTLCLFRLVVISLLLMRCGCQRCRKCKKTRRFCFSSRERRSCSR